MTVKTADRYGAGVEKAGHAAQRRTAGNNARAFGSACTPPSPPEAPMTASLLTELEEAKNRVAQIKRQIANATCAEVGHRWKFIGGAHCGCEGVIGCSVPVRECAICGDSDYGDSEESDFIKERCAMLSPTPPQGGEDER